MIKIAAAISAIALLFTSGLEALLISSPADRSTYGVGQPVEVLVVNDEGENYVSAAVTIASACGNIVANIPVGSTQTMYLPCSIKGETLVSARAGDAQAPNVHIMISPIYNTYPAGNIVPAPYGYPYAAEVGCGAPCGPIACPPRTSCRRSRRGCGYYGAEEANEISEFVAPQQEQEQQEQQQE